MFVWTRRNKFWKPSWKFFVQSRKIYNWFFSTKNPKCSSGDVECSSDNTSQKKFLFEVRQNSNFSDFSKKNSFEMFLWKSVLIWYYQLLSTIVLTESRASLNAPQDTFVFLEVLSSFIFEPFLTNRRWKLSQRYCASSATYFFETLLLSSELKHKRFVS